MLATRSGLIRLSNIPAVRTKVVEAPRNLPLSQTENTITKPLRAPQRYGFQPLFWSLNITPPFSNARHCIFHPNFYDSILIWAYDCYQLYPSYPLKYQFSHRKPFSRELLYCTTGHKQILLGTGEVSK